MSWNPDHDPLAPNGQPDSTEASAEPGRPLTEVERLAADLAVAEEQLAQSRDAQLRAMAEMENVRRRAQRDVEAAHKFAVERFATDIIEVRDTLELGIEASSTAAEPASIVEGLTATLRLIDKAFDKAGIAVIDPAGQPFNPEFHDAMVTQPTADHPPGTVLHVVQKGFTIGGRLLRAARVIVARAPD